METHLVNAVLRSSQRELALRIIAFGVQDVSLGRRHLGAHVTSIHNVPRPQADRRTVTSSPGADPDCAFTTVNEDTASTSLFRSSPKHLRDAGSICMRKPSQLDTSASSTHSALTVTRNTIVATLTAHTKRHRSCRQTTKSWQRASGMGVVSNTFCAIHVKFSRLRCNTPPAFETTVSTSPRAPWMRPPCYGSCVEACVHLWNLSANQLSCHPCGS